MGIKTYNPYTPSRRNMTGSDYKVNSGKEPLCISEEECRP